MYTAACNNAAVISCTVDFIADTLIARHTVAQSKRTIVYGDNWTFAAAR